MQTRLDRQFTHMTEEAYSHLAGERSSMLKKVLASPLHYRSAAAGRFRQTDPMKFGTLVHAMLFEPETLDTLFAVYPDTDATGKKLTRRGKAWEAFEATAGNRTIIREREWHSAKAMVDAMNKSDAVSGLLGEGEPELAAQWDDFGVTLKARFDWLHITETRVVAVGLKSAVSCAPNPFANQSVKLGYPLTWAMYHRALEVLLPGRALEMYEIVVEKTEPFDIAVYRITDDVLLTGEAHLGQAIQTLLECRRTNQWPGQAPGITDLHLPAWAVANVLDSDMTMTTEGGDDE